MYPSILNYRNKRYFWVALMLSVACIFAYYFQEPIGSPNGSTWLGYTLGTIGAIIIVCLMLLGLRKRSYSSRLGSLQGWVSAHIYLGTALLLIASLHSGWQFAYNVHTLTYGLMVVVVVSGFYGLYAYIRYPIRMSDNRSGDSLDELLGKLDKLDKQAIAEASSPELLQLIESTITGTQLGGTALQQLRASDDSKVHVPLSLDQSKRDQLVANPNQNVVVECLANRLSQLTGGEEAGAVQNLLANMTARQTFLKRIRRDIQIRAFLKIWLYFHVPLSVALLTALIVHVLVVFIYW
jgi:hypothetical protein